MPEYIVNLWLDGYDTEEQMEKACDEFIYDQLNFTASSVRVKKSDYAALLARHNALVEAARPIAGWYTEIRNHAVWDGKKVNPEMTVLGGCTVAQYDKLAALVGEEK